MKSPILYAWLAVVLAGGSLSIPAQTNPAPVAPAMVAPDRETATLEKHARPVLTALKLSDADQAAKVREILFAYFQALNGWHAEHDAPIKALWNQFNQARSKSDATNANAALAKIDGVYASFQPQHEKLLSGLARCR
jgi:hypothetical protein